MIIKLLQNYDTRDRESAGIESIARKCFFFEVSLLCILWGLVNIDFLSGKREPYFQPNSASNIFEVRF